MVDFVLTNAFNMVDAYFHCVEALSHHVWKHRTGEVDSFKRIRFKNFGISVPLNVPDPNGRLHQDVLGTSKEDSYTKMLIKLVRDRNNRFVRNLYMDCTTIS